MDLAREDLSGVVVMAVAGAGLNGMQSMASGSPR